MHLHFRVQKSIRPDQAVADMSALCDDDIDGKHDAGPRMCICMNKATRADEHRSLHQRF
jgi:hypothetical protein